MIELESLEEMFSNIAAGPKWDMSQPMLWGYFFTDESVEKLHIAAEELGRQGYRFVAVFEAEGDGEKEEPQAPLYFLQVEREEIHSPSSLHGRNAQLSAFAEQHELQSYDGMDVGPLNPRGKRDASAA
jgi:hypothetical protein